MKLATVIAFILLCFAMVGCMENTAKFMELEEKEYARFCNENPEHLRCQHGEKI